MKLSPCQNTFHLTLRYTYEQQSVCANFVWIIGLQTRENLKQLEHIMYRLFASIVD